jgi:uncharacterized membrane protein YgcG
MNFAGRKPTASAFNPFDGLDEVVVVDEVVEASSGGTGKRPAPPPSLPGSATATATAVTAAAAGGKGGGKAEGEGAEPPRQLGGAPKRAKTSTAKSVGFKVGDACEQRLDVLATLAKLSRFVLSDKKLLKAAPLLEQLLCAELPERREGGGGSGGSGGGISSSSSGSGNGSGGGSVTDAVRDGFFGALAAMMAPPHAARACAPWARGAYEALFRAAHTREAHFTSAQRRALWPMRLRAVTANALLTDDTYEFTRALKELRAAIALLDDGAAAADAVLVGERDSSGGGSSGGGGGGGGGAAFEAAARAWPLHSAVLAALEVAARQARHAWARAPVRECFREAAERRLRFPDGPLRVRLDGAHAALQRGSAVAASSSGLGAAQLGARRDARRNVVDVTRESVNKAVGKAYHPLRNVL